MPQSFAPHPSSRLSILALLVGGLTGALPQAQAPALDAGVRFEVASVK